MIEVFKQMTEALEDITRLLQGITGGTFSKLDAAIQAGRQAIAELESQEPVALETVYETIIQWDEGGGKRSRRDLARRIIDLYTHPPQRTWVGLTDDEQQQAYEQWQNEGWGVFYRSIEAKLKELNT